MEINLCQKYIKGGYLTPTGTEKLKSTASMMLNKACIN